MKSSDVPLSECQAPGSYLTDYNVPLAIITISCTQRNSNIRYHLDSAIASLVVLTTETAFACISVYCKLLKRLMKRNALCQLLPMLLLTLLTISLSANAAAVELAQTERPAPIRANYKRAMTPIAKTMILAGVSSAAIGSLAAGIQFVASSSYKRRNLRIDCEKNTEAMKSCLVGNGAASDKCKPFMNYDRVFCSTQCQNGNVGC